MFEVIILAVALGMDAFAVSLGLGARREPRIGRLAVLCAFYFGFFQGIMPLVGFLAGQSALAWLASMGPWIACSLLVMVGGKMFYEALFGTLESDIRTTTQRALLTLAIATSIDALAAGFALNLLPVSFLTACVIFSLTAALMSGAGVLLGQRTSALLGRRAEALGGVVLLLMAGRFALMA